MSDAMGWKRKQWDNKKITVVRRNSFVRRCKNCGSDQPAGSKAKKCWFCGKPVDTKVGHEQRHHTS